MTIVITAFERSPDGGKGLARDTRVRWALEEVGQPYEVRLLSFRAKKEPAHLRLHPFGLIPTYEEGDLVLFETGAIVFHIAEHHAGLFPDDANARARAITWMFAALNTVEPPILELVTARFVESEEPWAEERVPLVKGRIRDRLVQLSARLGDEDWFDGDFSAGDLMMVSVLLRLRASVFWTSFRNWPPMLPAASAACIRTGFRRPMGDQRRGFASWVTKFCIASSLAGDWTRAMDKTRARQLRISTHPLCARDTEVPDSQNPGASRSVKSFSAGSVRQRGGFCRSVPCASSYLQALFAYCGSWVGWPEGRCVAGVLRRRVAEGGEDLAVQNRNGGQRISAIGLS